MYVMFYSEALSNASAEIRNVVAADKGVVIEFVFHGKNTGSLGGAVGRSLAPTSTPVDGQLLNHCQSSKRESMAAVRT